MRLASTTLPLHKFQLLLFSFLLLSISAVKAQDNSPYSRYGLGNQFPRFNVPSRAMGGISAGYVGTYLGYANVNANNTRDSIPFTEVISVNYNNPASFAFFQANTEPRSGKLSSGRVILDAGINFSSRKLAEPNTPQSFRASDALFSHVYVGLPLKRNWGLAFGIRPLTRISYDIVRRERLSTVNDSVVTRFTGSGGSFLPTIGTGVAFGNLAIGGNIGYLFGKKEIVTRRGFANDSLEYAASNHTTNTNFGNLFFTAGAQYKIEFTKNSIVRLGVTGNWKQNLDATQDLLRQTYVRNANGEDLQVDSVFRQTDVAGEIVYPANYTFGFMYEHAASEKNRGWGFGVDYSMNQWDDFRFFGQPDQVKNNWELRFGGQLTPIRRPSRYGQSISWRFGAFVGPDYVNVDGKLPQFGLSFGMGLPVFNYNRMSDQYSVINLAVEYNRRGNDQNRIREELIRLSVGLNFTDLWFGKRRYD